jgi:VWFA-related protein
MTMRSTAVICCLLLTVASVGSQSSASDPQVRIVAPGEGALVTGLTTLRAAVEPPGLVASVVFFVDGRQVCSTTRPPFECEWDAGRTIASHQIRLIVNLTTGGRVVQTTRTIAMGFAETVDVEVVQVTVTVLDDQGRYVKGLPRSAFHVSENGRPQVLSHFYSENVPLELVVAVDISGSMQPAMPKMKQAIADFLRAVPTQHRVTLLAFNEDVFTVARQAADLETRMKGVEALVAWGPTVLYDGILRGVELLGLRPGRKALVVFTDGEDQGSQVTIDEVEQGLQASDLTLYMIGQGIGITSAPLRKVMERLAVPTGGRAFSTPSVRELHESFDELLEELSNQYVLAYEPTNSVRDDTWRQITVNVDGHRKVRARLGYRASPR